jgi:PPM family protein phosphatase
VITFGNAQIRGARQAQEDYFATFVMGHMHCAVLADGMGGHIAGAIASELAVKSFRGFLQSRSGAFLQDPPRYLLQALEHANQSIADWIEQQPGHAGMGTTLVALVLSEQERFHVSVGDSPLYRLRDGVLTRINENHAFAEALQEAVLAGSLSAEAAANHPDRSAITSALSGHDLDEVDAPDTGIATRAGDSYLLASDGIHSLSDEEIRQFLAASPNAQRAAENLVAGVSAKNLPQQDNTTVMVANVLGERITQPIHHGS